MQKVFMTPLGEICVYKDGVLSDFEIVPHDCKIQSVQENPVTGCYKITVSAENCREISCVISLNDSQVARRTDSGEHYGCVEFFEDNVIVTVGAADENAAFDTSPVDCGMVYRINDPVRKVTFGLAWDCNHEGQFDIRTYLAADVF